MAASGYGIEQVEFGLKLREIRDSFYLNLQFLSTRSPPEPNYSTVTLLARFLGLSTSVPLAQAVWWASSCSGTTVATHAMRQLAETHRQMTVCKVQAQALAPHPLDSSSL